MRNLMIIVTIAVLAASASAVPPVWWAANATVDIPVVMDIGPVAQIALNGAQIELLPINGTAADWEGFCPQALRPVITTNVRVDISGTVVPVAPLVCPNLGDWKIALFGEDYVAAPNASTITVDALLSPYPLGIAVKAEDVDMTVRPIQDNARVATVTITVTPN